MNERAVNAVLIIILLVVVAAAGIGIGWGIGTTVSPSAPASTATKTNPTTQVAKNASVAEPYSLTVAEIMGNEWNSTAGMQPKFLVQGSHGFLSSANISLPAHRLIQLTMVSYDTPTPNSTAQEAKVTGTVGGTVYLINGTLASMSNASMVMMPWGGNVSSVPVSSLAHTFTIQQLGINIPVVGGSTVVAYLYFNQPGTYAWLCLTPCGLGKDGLSGAMDTPGWMTGALIVR